MYKQFSIGSQRFVARIAAICLNDTSINAREARCPSNQACVVVLSGGNAIAGRCADSTRSMPAGGSIAS
jgi:hypothetical protein